MLRQVCTLISQWLLSYPSLSFLSFSILQFYYFISPYLFFLQIMHYHYSYKFITVNILFIYMDFRVRPSSKKSQQSQRSLVEFPIPRGFQSNIPQMRSLLIRLESLQGNFSNYQDLWRKQRQIINASFLDTQKKMDMLQYKAFTNQKDIKQLLQRDNDMHMSNRNDNQYDSLRSINQNEIASIKQALVQQRQAHREHSKHQAQIFEQMGRRQIRIQSEIRQLLSKQREDYDNRLNDQLQQIRNNENIKQKKIENQYELMKTVISNTEKKVFAQFERKIRNETVIKDFIEDRIAEMKQEIASEQRGLVAKQSKFVRQIKESIQSIFAIIKNTQKQLTEELAETQKLSANNIKKLSTSLELIKEKFTEDIARLNDDTSNIQSEIQEMKSFVNTKLEENREMLMEIEEQNFHNSRLSKEVQGLQNSRRPLSNQQTGRDEKSSNLQKQLNTWKASIEQKNLSVFKQISSTLKAMKLDWRKQNDQISSEVGSFKESVSNIKKSVPLEIKKSVQTIITVFNNQFDTLAQQLDTITDMIAVSKKETQKLLRDQVKKTEAQIMREVKELIKSSSRETLLQTEKNLSKLEQNMKMHTEQEIKFVKDLMIQKNASLESEMNQVSQSTKKNSLNTTAQLEDFTLKLKNFNESYKDYMEEQRKDDMKKRIQLQQAMRKNANNIMDIYYKKCEFLVDGMKKAIQMNIMKDMATMKRDVESLKEEQNKSIFQTKQQITNEINQKIDKLNQERENSEEILHETFDNQLNALRKNLSNEIGNSKLEINQKLNEVVEGFNEMKKKDTLSAEQFDSEVQAIKQAIWKIQAMSFSEQAKNKAIFDRIGEDITDLSRNVTVLAGQIQAK